MVSFEGVELSKFPEIDEVDSAFLQKSFDSFFRKVNGKEVKLHLSYKGYHKGGLRSQHEVHAKLLVDGKSFFVEVTDWKLGKTIDLCLEKLLREAQKARPL